MNIPEPNHNIASLIDKQHEATAEHPRPHMGASQLGHPCDRWLWLSFRWAVFPKFPGRMLRLFRRGHMEEETIKKDLESIGVKFKNIFHGNQDRVDFGSHVSGSIDGIINYGVPEAPNKRHIAEFKTHSLKSFDKLEKEGVIKSKPEHYIQMQIYMHGTGIDRSLYYAVCKNDDRIYTERLKYEKGIAERHIERGKRLALDDRMPPPISTDETWYQCRFCDAHEFCHKTKQTKQVNCRTCANVTATKESEFYCELHKANIPVDFQQQGCDDHVLHPDMVPWDMKESESEWEAVYIIDGKEVNNSARGFTSREIVANPKACANADETMIAIRETFDARIEE